ncbi:hypothetical protein LTR36_000895 [Oleoguttula mirabilis]|uniref:Uncharacterized protein n=1 Tax=Oleoguttula mirabilis TaxID=1507867 RepID=A0AAV9J2X6_9PEZI|nr:hypothetical protein LTR36_000895 [Oleoguttula mirabilis]
MGQYWKIINIDKAQSLENHGGLKLWEILMSTVAETLVDMLKLPRLLQYRFNDAAVAVARAKHVSSRLVALPQELIDAITALIESDTDVICLGLTNSDFFRLLAPELKKAVVRDEAPWAGDRLIFVGDYAHGVPDGLLADHELTDITSQHDLEDSEWKEYAQEPTEEAILHNLNTKELVRDRVVAESDYAYSLGEVVCTHAQRTHDPPGTEGLGCRGEWPGHRFDLATMHNLEEEWTDVSERAVGNLKAANLDDKLDGKRA